ncbi:MAG: ABC transporter permease [Vicinamibacterales bacterium]
MFADLRTAVRSLLRTPSFTAAAGLLLALGVGCTIAVFSVVDGVLLKALPYPDPDRIVTVWEATARSRTVGVSAPNFRDWREAASSFSALAAWSGGRTTVIGGQEPVVTGVYAVTRQFFTVFRAEPTLGRPFTPEESALHGPPAVVVSHGFWTRVLGGRTDLGALSLEVDGQRAPVVGVMPEGFAYPAGADVWFPLESQADTSSRTAHNYRVVARLGPGATVASAQAEMTTIAQRIEATYGAENDGTDASVIPLLEYSVRGARQVLLVLLAGVGVVLLATCANVANMVIARGADRVREFSMRVALGARRTHLVRMLLVENLVLAAGAVVVGLAGATALVRVLVRLAPASIPRLAEVGMDWRSAGFAAALALVTPVVFGLLPALHLSRRSTAETLAAGGRTGTAARGGAARQGLVALEIAVALLLVVSAALLGRSLLSLLTVDPGFVAEGVLTVETTVPGGHADGPDGASRLYEAWLARAAAVPGVARVGLVNAPPMSGLDANGGFMLDGQNWDDVKDDWVAQSALYRVASDGYFDAIGARLLRGRRFDARDVAGAEPAAIVNDALVRKHFAGRDPIGQRLRFAGMDEVNPWLTIVGVVDDMRVRDLADEAQPEVFVDYRQLPMRTRYGLTTAVRLQPGVEPEGVVAALRETWRALDPTVPVEMSRLSANVARSTASRRFALTIVAAFGVMALVLAALGVYGILSYAVARRGREIGIRMALGASPGNVRTLMAASIGPAVAAGLAAGVLAALGATRLLQSMLFGVSPADPATFAAAVAVLGVVAALAAWRPAARAARIDPALVMREE